MASEALCVAYITAPKGEARGLARKLVEAKLAACVNVIPVEASVFTWEGEVSDDDSENMLIVKTRQSLQDEVVEFVKHNHSYECPEVIFLPITGGIPGYLQWVTDSTRAPSSSS